MIFNHKFKSKVHCQTTIFKVVHQYYIDMFLNLTIESMKITTMKKLLFCLLLTVLGSSHIHAQRLTTGILSGTNFSNLRDDNQTGEWKTKTGTVSGVYFNYAFNRILSVGAEFNYTSLYYQHLDYQSPYYGPWMDPLSSQSNYILMPYYNTQNWNFNFYRFPVYLKLSTPTKLRFEVTAGVFYSLLQQPESTGNNTGSYYPKTDFGSIFSAGFAYPITRNVEAFIQGRYSTGSNEYISMNKGMIGSSELVIGIGYSGIFNKMKTRVAKYSKNDSTDSGFSMKYRSGLNLSAIVADKHAGSYSQKAGLTSGVALNYSLSKNFSIQTELLFENKGYQLKDSTNSHFMYIPNLYTNFSTSYTNATISNTYFTIPLLIQLKTSDRLAVYFNTGPYVSSLINAKTTGVQLTEYKNDSYSYTKSQTAIHDNIEGTVTPVDWGWILGGGIQIPLVYDWKLDIEGRYQASWTNLLSIPPSPSSVPEVGSTRSMKNRSLTLLIGLNIPIN